jgi:hypothetical protein
MLILSLNRLLKRCHVLGLNYNGVAAWGLGFHKGERCVSADADNVTAAKKRNSAIMTALEPDAAGPSQTDVSGDVQMGEPTGDEEEIEPSPTEKEQEPFAKKTNKTGRRRRRL